MIRLNPVYWVSTASLPDQITINYVSKTTLIGKHFSFKTFTKKSTHFQQLCIDFIDINFYYGTEAQITFTLLMVNIETLIY